VIDSGAELFGDLTPQPPSTNKNGFIPLSEFDTAEQGGNNDGIIDGRDAVFASLRLWQDTNHDGVSQAGELHTLPSLDIAALHLDYKESKRTDEFGNRFRYCAKIDDAWGAKAGRWAWDVFLVSRASRKYFSKDAAAAKRFLYSSINFSRPVILILTKSALASGGETPSHTNDSGQRGLGSNFEVEELTK
jgi:hypothetical protein